MTLVTERAADDVPARLRCWARGLYGVEAAVELLLRAFGGRFADPGWPWILSDAQCVWLDGSRIHNGIGALSGGEQRILQLVEALATGAPIGRLDDVLAGLDRAGLLLVLAAVAHAGGSHTDACLIRTDDGSIGWQRLPALVDWPEAA
jgi:hypothetical protein